MDVTQKQKDKHFSALSMDNFFRRLFISPKKFNKFIKKDDQVADLGSGPGYFTLPLAQRVGPEGYIYAVDSDKDAIEYLKRKAAESDLKNIEAYATSAENVPFITTGSIDFVLAWELLCCVAPGGHQAVVNEINRILKPDGMAMLSVDRYFGSYVTKAEWNMILAGFVIDNRNGFSLSKDRWALVSKKH